MRVKATEAAKDLALINIGVVRRRLTAGTNFEVFLVKNCVIGSIFLELAGLPESVVYTAPDTGDVLTVEFVDGAGLLRVTLLSEAYLDVFTVLVDDLVDAVEEFEDPEDGAKALLVRLRRWERLFQATQRGMSSSAQRGLLGELHVLGAVASRIGMDAAIVGWTGPEGGTRDFEIGVTGIEVKTTAGKGALAVRISSERQLERVAVDSLFLWCNSIERSDLGASLAEVVDNLLAGLAAEPRSRLELERKLALVGYYHPDRHRYTTKYLVRESLCFRVGPGFPSLTSSGLPNGVSDVSYLLTLAACEDWRVSPEAVLDDIGHE